MGAVELAGEMYLVTRVSLCLVHVIVQRIGGDVALQIGGVIDKVVEAVVDLEDEFATEVGDFNALVAKGLASLLVTLF